ncbi:MAG: cardiolipin synthase B [Gemmatimonadales bacterium]|nr:cardiolipin synthase B [Gemmatimonadales bacterium]
MQRVMSRTARSRPVPGNAVRLVLDAGALDAMLDVITGAERWVHFENYIIRSDETGWRFAEAWLAAAQRGVSVRVLYDWLGSRGTSRQLWRTLRAAGVEVRSFNPPRVLDVLANLTRDHRKLVVADGIRAIVGGMCIGNEWAGDASREVRPWRDTAVEIEGPAAAALDQSFATLWTQARGALPSEEHATDVPASGEAAVQVVAGVPGRGRVFRMLELLAAGCTERLWITDAYLVAPRRLSRVFIDAAREAVDVRLLVPGSSDIPVVRNLTRIGYRDLLRAGVRIYEWNGPMLHAKSLVVDGRWVRIGSSNLNASSLLGNYELDVFIDGSALAEEAEQRFRRDIARSTEIRRLLPRRPGRLGYVLPGSLGREEPEISADTHRRTARERRRQAAIALRTVAAGARRSFFGPISLGLVLAGTFFFILPQVSAYAFGVILLWLAIGAGYEAFRRRAR